MSISSSEPIAVLDANVLFSMRLCDTLMRAALAGVYRACWNQMILDEVARNLVRHARTTVEGAQRRCTNMQHALPAATITGHEPLVPMTNNPKDRHVLATAVHARAGVIVTYNLRHFPRHALAPYDIEAQSADTFLHLLLNRAPLQMIQVIREQSAALRNPPHSVNQVLDNLAIEVPLFARTIREMFASVEIEGHES